MGVSTDDLLAPASGATVDDLLAPAPQPAFTGALGASVFDTLAHGRQGSGPINLSQPSTLFGDTTPTQGQALDQNLGQAANVLRATGEAVFTPLAPLTIPLRMAAGGTARAVGAGHDLIGELPSKPTLGDYYHQVVPEITFLDVADFIAKQSLGTEDEYIKANPAMLPGDAGNRYQHIRDLAKGAGIAADFVLDPLKEMTFMQLTEKAMAARMTGSFKSEGDVILDAALQGKLLDPLKFEDRMQIIQGVGQYTDNSRNLLTFGPARVPMPKALERGLNKLSDTTLGDLASRFSDSFDYRIGIPELDQDLVRNMAQTESAKRQIISGFAKDMAKLDLTQDEKTLVGRLVENTDNLMPKEIPSSKQVPKVETYYENVDGELIPKTKTTIVEKSVGKGLGSYDPDTIKARMTSQFDRLGEGLADVNPERKEDIVNAAMRIKEVNANINGRQYAAGLLSDDNLPNTILKNYLAHVVSDEGKAALARYKKGIIKDPEIVAEAELEAHQKDLSKAVNKTPLSSLNINRLKREVEGSAEQAQAIMKEKYGIDGFYVKDPFVATSIRWAQSEKMLSNKEFLDKMAKYGVVPVSREQKVLLESRGWGPLNINEFQGKLLNSQKDGIPQLVKFEDHYFPPNIVSKVGHWIKPNDIGNFAAFVQSFNKVFKSAALLTPGFHARNTLEDIFKYYASGGTIKGLSESAKAVFSGMSKSLENQTVKLGGKSYTYGELRNAIHGMAGMSDSHYINLAESIFSGKTLLQRTGENLVNPMKLGKTLIQTFQNVGEGGVHFMRGAMYVDLLDKGYSPAAALFQAQHIMFDFRRTTEAIDKARTFWDPFIQHAIKTAFITPELVGKAPAAYNFFINNLPKYLAWTISDPVTDQYLQNVAPDYLKSREPMGALMPGNSVLAAMFKPPAKTPDGHQYAAFITPEIGPQILKKFAIWDQANLKRSSGFGPLMMMMARGITGFDNNGKPIDADPKRPDFLGRVLRTTLDAAGTAAFATPGVWNLIKDQLKMGAQPNFAPSLNMQLAQASFGQFLHFDDIQKQYLLRTNMFVAAAKDLQRQLGPAMAREITSKDLPANLTNYPKIIQKVIITAYPDKAQSLFQRYINENEDFKRARVSMEGVRQEKSVSQIISEMKLIKQETDRLNDIHRTLTKAMLERAAERKK